jgi:hypothetical protein
MPQRSLGIRRAGAADIGRVAVLSAGRDIWPGVIDVMVLVLTILASLCSASRLGVL